MVKNIKQIIKYIIKSDYKEKVKSSKKQKKLQKACEKYKNLNDEEYLKIIYKIRTGKNLNLDNPKTFNEKLQWLKIYNRNPVYTTMVDKYAVKKYVADIIGEEYVIPLYGVYDRFDEINFDKLPNRFVLKTTHNSGGVIICKDKSNFNKEMAKFKIEKFLEGDSYQAKREWPYKDVPHRIIAEQYMEDCINEVLVVYKVFCFNGKPVLIQTIQGDKTKQESIDYFDTEWNLLKLRQNFPNSKTHMKKPVCLDEILKLSSKCSAGFPFLRTDWYEINGKVYFSEFTFFSDSGCEPFHPQKWDKILGNYIDLSLVKKDN